MMPEMDGPATLEALRKSGAAPETPVIFMTAQARPEEIQRLMDLGAVGIIAKPYDAQTLPEQLHTVWAAQSNVS